MEEQKKQRGGWFGRRGRGNSTAPTAPQPSNSGKFTQTMSTWVRALQERRDNANRTRDLANKLNSELAAILQTCAEQDKALGQRSIRTQVQLSMALGRLTGIVRQLDATRAVCAYLVEATQPQLPVVAVAALAGVNGNGSQATAMLAAPAAPSRPLFATGNSSGPLAAPVVRDLGRGGYKRMARDLQQAFRETAHATQDILRPIQTQGIRLPDVNALASALAALEPLMTWLNQRCEALTATYCAPAN
jgi:hypothetical protein